MTRGTILKDFFKNTVLTVGIAYLLFTWGKILFIHDGQGEYFYVALFCGVPFGIRRMFIWLVPFGHDITFTIGIFAVNIIVCNTSTPAASDIVSLPLRITRLI